MKIQAPGCARLRPVAPMMAALMVLILGAVPAGAAQDDPVSRLQALQPEAARTRILVVSTFHLSQIKKEFKPEMLDGVVEALARFRPDAIAVEKLPGPRVLEYEFRRDASPLYAEVLERFGAGHLALGKAALEILKTSPQAAINRVRELLAERRTLAGKVPPEARANLALWMAAAYDPASAVLQWSYLTPEERRAQKLIPAELAARFDSDAAAVNEVPALAVRLALRAGLDRLDAVDDFEDLDVYPEFLPGLEEDVEGSTLMKNVSKARVYTDSAGSLKDVLAAGDLMPQYRLLNTPAYATDDVDAQWGVFLRSHFPSGSDRSRLGLWENRNLKIAARVRAVAALHPGGRVLVIYGAAHRPFLEAYLEKTADVRIIPFSELDSGR